MVESPIAGSELQMFIKLNNQYTPCTVLTCIVDKSNVSNRIRLEDGAEMVVPNHHLLTKEKFKVRLRNKDGELKDVEVDEFHRVKAGKFAKNQLGQGWDIEQVVAEGEDFNPEVSVTAVSADGSKNTIRVDGGKKALHATIKYLSGKANNGLFLTIEGFNFRLEQ